MILGNVAVVEVGDAKIEQDIEKKRKIEHSGIKTITLKTNQVLHTAVDAKYPEWLDQQVQKQQQAQVSDEFFLHDCKCKK